LSFSCHTRQDARGTRSGASCGPTFSPAQLKNSFHVTLHRLRRILGRPDWIVFEEGRYRIKSGLTP